MHSIDIFRNGLPYINIKPEDNSSQNKQVMGENFIQLEFTLNTYVSFKLGDYCVVFGETYSLSDMPAITKESKFRFKYTMKLTAEGSDLAKVQFLFLGSDNTLKEPEFSLMGNAQTFLNLILQNANRAGTGWTLGEVITTDYKNLTFSNDSCLSALAKVAEAFSTEWWVLGKVIHLTRISVDTGITFKHGRSKGLYDISRQNISQNAIITRLYPFGSDKNIPSDYGSKRLRLKVLNQYSISNLTCVVTDVGGGNSSFTFEWDEPTAPGANAITLNYRLANSSAIWGPSTGSYISPRTIILPTGTYEFYFTISPFGVSTPVVTIGASTTTPLLTGLPQPYLESNISQYGVIEYTKIFDDVYPHRTGTVSSVDSTDIYKFRDLSIDFDVNAQLLPGLTAKVVFNTGQLSGYQFEIQAFNNSLKEFRILKNKDETALDIPSSLLKPAIGDKYVLVDIRMPSAYVDAAENDLLQKAQEMLLKASVPQYTYSITLDPVFLRNHNYTIKIGDEVWITDSDLEVNRKIRVISLVRKIIQENEYQLQLSDTVSQGTIAQINNNVSSAQSGLSQLQGQIQNAAIFNGKVIGDLKMEQGTLVMPDIPQTSTLTGFEAVVREISSGKLFRKV